MSFTSTDPVSHSGKTNIWLTPKHIIDQLGPFDFDPCAAPKPRPFPTAAVMNSEDDADGLSIDWFGRVWLNPPYGSNARHWIQRLSTHGNGIALVFARIETQWLQPFLNQGVFVIQGRLSFLRPDGSSETNAGTGSILIPFGRKNIGSILMSEIEGVWLQ